MPLYRCEECGCVENTALGFYWSSDSDTSDWPEGFAGKRLCSEHGPATYSEGSPTGWGKWHGRFEKRSAEGMLVDQSGFLWSTDEVNIDKLPSIVTIVAKIVDGVVQPFSL